MQKHFPRYQHARQRHKVQNVQKPSTDFSQSNPATYKTDYYTQTKGTSFLREAGATLENQPG